MNHRSALRNNKEIPIWLYQDDYLVTQAKTENLTDQGMCIKTNGLLFPKNATIDIAFAPENNKPLKRRRAKVVHRSLGSIGIMFSNCDAQPN